MAGGDPRSAASGSVGGSHDVILPECRLLTFPSGEVNGKEEEERGGERRREEERGVKGRVECFRFLAGMFVFVRWSL